MELPDWNVEERERGMIDLKRGNLSLFFHFSFFCISQQKGERFTDSILEYCYINHFTANAWQSREPFHQISHSSVAKKLSNALKRGPETFWDPVQLA